jgi:MFS family permease
MQEAPVLRPLGVGDIIDRMLRLLRADPVLFIGIAVLPNLVSEVLQRAVGLSQTLDLNDFSAAFTTSGTRPVFPSQVRTTNVGAAIVVVLVSIVIGLVQTGALIEATGQRYLGRPISVREAYARGLRAVPRLFLSALVVIVAVTVAVGVFSLAVTLLAVTAVAGLAAVAVIVGLIGFFFVLPWAIVSLSLVGPAIVVEGLGPIAAIRRSLHLIDKARLRTLGLYLLIWVISVILGIILGIVFLASFVAEPTVRSVLQTVASVASASISGPLFFGVLVILYYDLRVRKEAFDLQLAAEALPREA